MIRLLQKISNWKFILPFFLIFGYMTLYVFPQYQLQLTQLAGEEVKTLDVRFSYSPSEVNRLFEKLGADGRELYEKVVGRVDMIFPFSYAFFFGLLLSYLSRKLWSGKPKLIFIALLPVLAALFDFMENFNTLNLLRQYPDIEVQKVIWGEQMTRVKQILLGASVILILLLAIALLIKAVVQRRQKQHTS